jgi:hypothetical protein
MSAAGPAPWDSAVCGQDSAVGDVGGFDLLEDDADGLALRVEDRDGISSSPGDWLWVEGSIGQN